LGGRPSESKERKKKVRTAGAVQKKSTLEKGKKRDSEKRLTYPRGKKKKKKKKGSDNAARRERVEGGQTPASKKRGEKSSKKKKGAPF